MQKSIPSLKAILFDLDGTIIDTHDAILASMQYTMRTILGKEFSPAHLMKKVGQPLKTQMEDFARSAEERDEMLRVYRAYQAQIHDQKVKAFPGMKQALEALRQAGFPLGVVTSKLHAPALHGLEFFGLEGYFSCLVGADDCEKHKPDPFPVTLGANLLGFEAKECVYVGDSPYDIQAGNAAGAITIAAQWGMFSDEDLAAENPTYTCASISDVVSLLLA